MGSEEPKRRRPRLSGNLPRDLWRFAKALGAGIGAVVSNPDGDSAAGSAASREAASELRPLHFPFDEITVLLEAAIEPLEELKALVGDIRTREAAADAGRSDARLPPPSDVERYFARILEEAGLFSNDVEMPVLRVVRPTRSSMFYIRIEDETLPYLAKLRTIQLEAALNRMHFADVYFDDLDTVSLEELYRLNQNLTRSIAAQLPSLLERIDSVELDGEGEWSTRAGIATGIETFQLPYRLTSQFRLNLAAGKAAFNLDLTPAEVFPASIYSEELDRVIPTTSTMREQMASEYALRLGILVAAHAFWCSDHIEEVWVAGILDDASAHRCLYSVRFPRHAFRTLDLERIEDPAEIFSACSANMQLENGILQPVKTGFSLEDEAFCPSERYEIPELSDRELDEHIAVALGARRVRDVAINEEASRERMASELSRHLSESTENNVRTIMELAGRDPDPSVRNAARRTVEKLIEGTMPELDAYEFESEFVEGDPLSKAVQNAWEYLNELKVAAAANELSRELFIIDDMGTYVDNEAVEFRSFSSYTERTLYNRLYATEGREVVLVPRAYYEAHLLLGRLMLELKRNDEALEHTRRAMELSPLSAHAHLSLVRCLESMGDYEACIEELKRLLEHAFEPDGVAAGYYRMAFFQLRRGKRELAEACYRKSMEYMSHIFPIAAMELLTLVMPGMSSEIDGNEINAMLQREGIPLAPTPRISALIRDSARAALDAEIFPAARDLTRILGAFSSDDVLNGIIRSMEREPDR